MKESRRPRWTLKAIVKDKDHWERYQEAYQGQVSQHQIREVEKMLGCGELKNGYQTFICLHCGERKREGFRCKSRVCSSCGKVHADNWAQQLTRRMFNVTHRHMTFTVARELWSHLEQEPRWRPILFEAAAVTLGKVMKIKAGIAMVMHPYGKDLKVNYHLHALVTEGGMDEKGEWREQKFFNYKALRRIWQYEVLSRLRAVMPVIAQTKQLINSLFEKYPDGFYVHAEPRVTDGQGVSRYIGRYIRHPAIADSRIVAYDGQQVTFSYDERVAGQKVRRQQTVPVLEFIHGVVRHIPPKQFKMVRYYGLYAPRKADAIHDILHQIGQLVGRTIRRLSWRERIRHSFQRDPLTCPRCGTTEMELFSLTLPWQGKEIILGGFRWLFERGCLIESRPEQPLPNLPEPQMKQLALPL